MAFEMHALVAGRPSGGCGLNLEQHFLHVGSSMSEIATHRHVRPPSAPTRSSPEESGRPAPRARDADQKPKERAAERADDGITTIPPLAQDVEGSQVD